MLQNPIRPINTPATTDNTIPRVGGFLTAVAKRL